MVEDSDLVLEILDARDPLATRHAKIDTIADRLGKQVIYVLNKADLVPRDVLERWKRFFEDRGAVAVYLSAKYRLGTRMLFIYIRRHMPAVPVRVAVVGYPNVGKSTIINYLRGRHVAQTSPQPGWTRGEQLVRAKTWLYVIDTPGVIPIEDYSDPALVVVRGGIDPHHADDAVLYAYHFVQRVLRYNPDAFGGLKDPVGIIERVGRNRGMLTKGGRVNMESAARALLSDWIRGKITYWYEPPSQ